MSGAWSSTSTETFHTVMKIVKYSSVPHFLTATEGASSDPQKAMRFSSAAAAQGAAKALNEQGGWYVPKLMTLTITHAIEDVP